MKRAELEHLLRASSGTTGEKDFIIIGSQSVLGKHPDAPRELRQSMELDIYARDKPDLRIEIERNLGELSRFSETYGYFADGVGPDTALLPKGWETRLTAVCNENTGGATGTPAERVARLNAEFAAARNAPETRAHAVFAESISLAGPADAFAVFLRTKHEHWSALIQDAGLRLNP